VPKNRLALGPRRDPAQPVDAATLANPLAHLNVLVLTAEFEAELGGLAGGEKPLLALGDFIEGVQVGFRWIFYGMKIQIFSSGLEIQTTISAAGQQRLDFRAKLDDWSGGRGWLGIVAEKGTNEALGKLDGFLTRLCDWGARKGAGCGEEAAEGEKRYGFTG
jgi:hypothetical protein